MKEKRSKFILLLLALLFIAPGVSAYLFYMHPQWLKGKTINKGHFIRPVEQLSIFSEDNHWRMILWSPTACEKQCLNQLDALARVRLALGHRLYQVDLWLLLDPKAPAPSASTLKVMQNYHIQWQHLAQKPAAFDQAMATFIATPHQELILKYHQGNQLKDIYHDIKHLLTSSEAST